MINFREWNWLLQIIIVFAVLAFGLWIILSILNPPPPPEVVEMEVEGYIDFNQFLRGFNFKGSYQQGCVGMICTNGTSLSFWGNVTYKNGIVERFDDGRQLTGFFIIRKIDYFTSEFPRLPFRASFKGYVAEFGPDPIGWIWENKFLFSTVAFAILAFYFMTRKRIGPQKQITWAANRIREVIGGEWGWTIYGSVLGEVDNEISPNYYKMKYEARPLGSEVRQRYWSTVNMKNGAVSGAVELTPSMEEKLFRTESLPQREELEKTQRAYTPADLESRGQEEYMRGLEMGRSQQKTGFLRNRKQASPSPTQPSREEE